MHHGQNRGKPKRKLSKKRKFCGNKGEMYKFCGNRGKFRNFLEIGGKYAIFIIGLEGWTASDSSSCSLSAL